VGGTGEHGREAKRYLALGRVRCGSGVALENGKIPGMQICLSSRRERERSRRIEIALPPSSFCLSLQLSGSLFYVKINQIFFKKTIIKK
jgi:hypothetical protein